MDIIPVLDLLHGHVVRGVAGRRDTYAPLQSRLARSAQPLDVARGLREAFDLHRLYVADLDAIMHDTPHWSIIESLVSDGFDLLIDAGLREPARALQLIERGAVQVVAALETLPHREALADITHAVGAERVVFSLDLMDGQPMGDLAAWKASTHLSIVDAALTTGVSSLIVLDLAGVGVGRGVPTLDLCRELIRHSNQLRVITGGGVRDQTDLKHAAEAGIDGLLIASALHDGSITPAELATISESDTSTTIGTT